KFRGLGFHQRPKFEIRFAVEIEQVAGEPTNDGRPFERRLAVAGEKLALHLRLDISRRGLAAVPCRHPLKGIKTTFCFDDAGALVRLTRKTVAGVAEQSAPDVAVADVRRNFEREVARRLFQNQRLESRSPTHTI